MLKQGPPPKQGRTGKISQYIGAFVLVGIVLYALVVRLEATLDEISKSLLSVAGYILPQMLIGVIFSGLVGAIQAWILREHLDNQNLVKFIGFAMFGGAVGGFVAGVIMNITETGTLFIPGLLTGAVAGALAGGVSSAGQNTFMSSAGRKGQWMTYSIISWTLIWGIGWGISWQIGYLAGTSVGSILMMIASGVALSVFLSKTAIEF